MMDCEKLLDLIKKRRSIRNYLPDPIPDEDINSILEAGLYAPSGKNRQPWRFFVVKDVKTIRSIAKTTNYGKFARHAPVMVLVFAKTDSDYPFEKDLIGIGACLQNMMLTATVLGYGSCVIGELFERTDPVTQDVVIATSQHILVAGLVVGTVPQLTPNAKTIKLEDYFLELPKDTQYSASNLASHQ